MGKQLVLSHGRMDCHCDEGRPHLSSVGLGRLFFCSREYFIPNVVFTGGTISAKRLLQKLEVGNSFYIDPAPIRQCFATLPTNLITEQANSASVPSIIVRFGDSELIAILKSNEPVSIHSVQKKGMNLTRLFCR